MTRKETRLAAARATPRNEIDTPKGPVPITAKFAAPETARLLLNAWWPRSEFHTFRGPDGKIWATPAKYADRLEA